MDAGIEASFGMGWVPLMRGRRRGGWEVMGWGMKRRVLMLMLMLVMAGVVRVMAGDFPEPVDSERAGGVPLMGAEEAAAAWRVPAGCRVTVVASEPEVRNPIAMSWDGRGRLWVAENFTYAEPSVRFDERQRDRVVIFELGKDGGRASGRKVFVDGLQRLTSVQPGRGGVWLMCPPELLFVPDADGDDVPDGPPVTVLDGFTVAQGNYHNFANGLRWGPDGWLYGRCGHSCPGKPGVPGTPEAKRPGLEGGIWRYHPERKTVEVLAHGTTNPWGHDWDAHGELFFINTVNGHLWHMIPGAHFLESFGTDPNPYVYERLDMHADHWHFDRGKGWQQSRDGKANELGGGHAHVGMMICQGSSWPASMEGKLVTFNMHGRRLNVERLEREGSGYVGRHEPDVLLSGDPWFRGMDLTTGPDGAVYVIDWSDTGECHDHTGVHRNSGRIYRVAGERASGEELRLPLGKADGEKVLRHANPWYERRWREQLRAGDVSEDWLRGVVAGGGLVVERLRALWALQALGKAGEDVLMPLLEAEDEHLRVWALRLLSDGWPMDDIVGRREAGPGPGAALEEKLVRMAAGDASGLVRLALASMLQRLPAASRGKLAAALTGRAEDAGDHNLPEMVWYGLTPLVTSDPEGVAELAAGSRWERLTRWAARALMDRAESAPGALARLVKAAAAGDEGRRRAVLEGLAEGSRGRRRVAKPEGWELLARAAGAGEAGIVRRLESVFGEGVALEELRAMVKDGRAAMGARRQALASLNDARVGDLREICVSVLGVRELAGEAMRGLAASGDAAAGVEVLAKFRGFDEEGKAAALGMLVSRVEWSMALLEAVRAGKVPRGMVSSYHARQMAAHGDEALGKRLAEVWGEVRGRPEEKRKRLEALRGELTAERLAKGDAAKGKLVFRVHCGACHTLFGEGGKAGPDLTGSGRRQLDYVLPNLVDPSGEVGADYRLVVVRMKDGRVLSGIPAARGEQTLTLRQITGDVTVERREIEKEETAAESMMPEGLVEAMGVDGLVDLLRYVMGEGD